MKQNIKMPEKLIDAVRGNKLVPLIGTGISKHAILPKGGTFPDWDILLKELAKEGNRTGKLTDEFYEQIINDKVGLLKQGKYLLVAQTLVEKLNKKYFNIIQEMFDPPGLQSADIHKTLIRLKTPLLLTTNYDRLLEHAYQHVFNENATCYKHKDADIVQSKLQNWKNTDPPIIFKLHGCVTDLESIILTEDDYRNLKYRKPGYHTIMSAIVTTHTLLMIGFSFNDPDIRLILEHLHESLRYSSLPHYLLLPENQITKLEILRYEEDFNIMTILYRPSGKHEEILEFIENLSKHQNMETTEKHVQKCARITERFINHSAGGLNGRSARLI